MPLTPQDVELKQFAKEFRGYDMEEVDAFLDEVQSELERLLTENQAVASRAAAAEAQRADAGPSQPAPTQAAPVDPPAPVAQPPAVVAPDEPQQAALRTLLMAQRTADQAVAEAKEEADRVLTEARRRSGQVDAEINARTSAALAELDAQRRELEIRIEDLRAFEREYRLRLKAYLESQLKDLSTRTAGGEEVGSGVPQAARTAAVGVLTPGVAHSAAARSPEPPVSAPSPQPEPPVSSPPPPPEPPASSSPPPPPAARPPIGQEQHGQEQQAVTAGDPAHPADEVFPEIQPGVGGTQAPGPAGPPREADAPGMGPFAPVPPPVPLERPSHDADRTDVP